MPPLLPSVIFCDGLFSRAAPGNCHADGGFSRILGLVAWESISDSVPILLRPLDLFNLNLMHEFWATSNMDLDRQTKTKGGGGVSLKSRTAQVATWWSLLWCEWV